MRSNGKLKTIVMSTALAGVMAAAPIGAHAEPITQPDQLLHQGMNVQDVKPLQIQLKDFDYYQNEVDGIFGPRTFRAVSAFQKDYDLDVDGIFGSSTFDVLKKVESLQDIFKKAPVLSKGDHSKVVKKLQTQLQHLEYYKGDLDSMYGTLTEDAVKAFQQANDVAVDGMAGPDTYKALIHNPVKAKEAKSSDDAGGSTKVESASTSSVKADDSSESTNVSQSNDTSAVQILNMNSTAYTANCNGCSGVTATGINLNAHSGKKVIAVDPDVIPLGSKVWVEGYGYAIAGDTGGAINGKRIDVFFPSHSKAMSWGRKTVTVKVYK